VVEICVSGISRRVAAVSLLSIAVRDALTREQRGRRLETVKVLDAVVSPEFEMTDARFDCFPRFVDCETTMTRR
jgi:hypothetical protein